MMNALLQIVTIPEAARLWHKHPTTVRRARDSRHNPLDVRETGHSWLITVESLRQRWGDPCAPLESLLA